MRCVEIIFQSSQTAKTFAAHTETFTTDCIILYQEDLLKPRCFQIRDYMIGVSAFLFFGVRD